MDLSPVLIETEADQPTTTAICPVCQKYVGLTILTGREVIDIHLNPDQESCTGSYCSTDLVYLD